ncbi:hypothetical protein [Zavarzinella formosa]|uniref:hypothetical protein n=1 Tax=Zavarzinella formosa TaxID=360055 RepID=UPI00030B3E51|nr:hypothetical protein [Zavarzinella formosa]
MPRTLTRADYLNAEIPKPEPFAVPELRIDGDAEDPVVFIKHLDGNGRTDLGKKLSSTKSEADTQAIAVIVGVVDDAGVPLFTDADIKAIEAKDGTLLFRLAERVLAINGFGRKATEDIEKNSVTTPKSVSGSNSPTDTPAPSAS